MWIPPLFLNSDFCFLEQDSSCPCKSFASPLIILINQSKRATQELVGRLRWLFIKSVKVGLKISKQGPAKVENVGGAPCPYQLLNYLTKTIYIHDLISKKRRRILIGGYDFGMSYITDCLLAMSFTAERIRAMYQNPPAGQGCARQETCGTLQGVLVQPP